ncbi:hypothetical protein SAMN05446935_0356 [Burkholderia sp. YR290]|nr:hypothetical protein SAMN05446935_0356 [Burkholderia sp. YR290]
MLPLFNTETAQACRAARAAGLELHRESPHWVLRKPADESLYHGFAVWRATEGDLGRFQTLAQVRYYLQTYNAA